MNQNTLLKVNHKLKISVIFFLSILLVSPTFFETEKWIVEEQSVLTINGKTNINNFQCRLPSKKEKDTLIISSNNKRELKFEKGKVKVDPTIFNCGNEFIKRDFLETLQVKDYPFIFINFIDVRFREFNDDLHHNANGHVNIYICGVNKVYDIDFEVDRKGDGELVLNGRQELKLSEFNIKTPSRLMGLIKVSDDIEIQFKLLLSKHKS